MIIWNNNELNKTPIFVGGCECRTFDQIQIQVTALGVNCDDRISLEDVPFDICREMVIVRADATDLPCGLYSIVINGYDTTVPEVTCEIYNGILQVNDATKCSN